MAQHTLYNAFVKQLSSNNKTDRQDRLKYFCWNWRKTQ